MSALMNYAFPSWLPHEVALLDTISRLCEAGPVMLGDILEGAFFSETNGRALILQRKGHFGYFYLRAANFQDVTSRDQSYRELLDVLMLLSQLLQQGFAIRYETAPSDEAALVYVGEMFAQPKAVVARYLLNKRGDYTEDPATSLEANGTVLYRGIRLEGEVYDLVESHTRGFIYSSHALRSLLQAKALPNYDQRPSLEPQRCSEAAAYADALQELAALQQSYTKVLTQHVELVSNIQCSVSEGTKEPTANVLETAGIEAAKPLSSQVRHAHPLRTLVAFVAGMLLGIGVSATYRWAKADTTLPSAIQEHGSVQGTPASLRVALANEPSRGDLHRDMLQLLRNEAGEGALPSTTSTGLLDREQIPVEPPSFLFPEDTHTIPADGPQRTYGIDISHYTPVTLPIAELPAMGVHFVYAKATQGTVYVDPSFPVFWSRLGAINSVRRGAYHYLNPSDDVQLQAKNFVAYLREQGPLLERDLAPALDVELSEQCLSENGGHCLAWKLVCQQVSESGHCLRVSPDLWAAESPQQIVAKILTWLREVQQALGRVPMLYTNAAWLRSRGIQEEDLQPLSGYPIWIAEYTKRQANPRWFYKRQWLIWQFSATSRLLSSTGPVFPLDANFFPGKPNDLWRALGASTDVELQPSLLQK